MHNMGKVYDKVDAQFTSIYPNLKMKNEELAQYTCTSMPFQVVLRIISYIEILTTATKYVIMIKDMEGMEHRPLSI